MDAQQRISTNLRKSYSSPVRGSTAASAAAPAPHDATPFTSGLITTWQQVPLRCPTIIGRLVTWTRPYLNSRARASYLWWDSTSTSSRGPSHRALAASPRPRPTQGFHPSVTAVTRRSGSRASTQEAVSGAALAAARPGNPSGKQKGTD